MKCVKIKLNYDVENLFLIASMIGNILSLIMVDDTAQISMWDWMSL